MEATVHVFKQVEDPDAKKLDRAVLSLMSTKGYEMNSRNSPQNHNMNLLVSFVMNIYYIDILY